MKSNLDGKKPTLSASTMSRNISSNGMCIKVPPTKKNWQYANYTNKENATGTFSTSVENGLWKKKFSNGFQKFWISKVSKIFQKFQSFEPYKANNIK